MGSECAVRIGPTRWGRASHAPHTWGCRMRGRLLALISLISLALLGSPALPEAAVATSAPAAAAISVTPATAGPGATVTVRGTGYSGDCGVLVYWGSTDGLVLGGGK